MGKKEQEASLNASCSTFHRFKISPIRDKSLPSKLQTHPYIVTTSQNEYGTIRLRVPQEVFR